MQVYITDINENSEKTLLGQYGPFFDSKRLERLDRAKSGKAKSELITGGALLLMALKEHGIVDTIIYRDNGKPMLQNRDDFFFSMSHSGDYVLLAVSDEEIGLDVQRVTKVNESLKKRISSEAERERFKELYDKKFNLIWAVKESYSKLDGRGIQLPFDKITFDIDDLYIRIYYESEPKAYGVRVYSDDTYEAVVCSGKEITNFEIKKVVL